MSRVPQKINNIVEIFSFNGCRLRTQNVRGGGGVGSMRTDADKGGAGSKIGKILRTSFMYDPLHERQFDLYYPRTSLIKQFLRPKFSTLKYHG